MALRIAVRFQVGIHHRVSNSVPMRRGVAASPANAFSQLLHFECETTPRFGDNGVANAYLQHRSATGTPASCSFDPNELLFRKKTALQALVLVLAQSELQPG